ncbi:ABC transporter substrate-binding protein [Parafrigoribacterium humi]|uniref:ABC transporter substrate-binding protein n=1 Tax=Parafrigoribacterium humi TaxID=3144664 RepID=UPI0032EB7C93
MVSKKHLIRQIAVLSATAVLAAGLAACGSTSGGNTTDAKAGKDILIGMNSGLVPQFQRYAKEFEKTHKGFKITVKAVPDAQPDYIQQLVTQGLSKALPDIIFNYDSLNQTLNSNHLLYDLKPWLDSGHDGLKASSFIPAFLDQYRVGDTVTGIPVSADTGVVVIHTALFEKYGVPVPTADWTTEDMYAAAKAITEKSSGKVYGIKTPLVDGASVFTFYPTLKAYGSGIYDPDTKKFIFANEGGIKAWTELLRPYTEKFGTPYSLATNSTLFESNQDAMGVGSTAGIAGLRVKMKDAWDVLPMPTVNGKSGTGGGSYSLSISAKSDNKEGAYQFMAWFYSTDGGMKTAQPDGVIPPTVDGIAHGAWLTEAAPVPPSFVKTIKASVPKAILPNPIPDAIQPKVVPALQTALQQVVLKGMSIKEAYTAAQDELNKLLK